MLPEATLSDRILRGDMLVSPLGVEFPVRILWGDLEPSFPLEEFAADGGSGVTVRCREKSSAEG